MAMQFDRRDRCLHICMLGDAGIGHSSFLKCYGAQAQAGENAEDSLTRESNGKQWKTCCIQNIQTRSTLFWPCILKDLHRRYIVT